MAVIPGKKITQADLIELADQANALTSTVFDLSAFFDVSPMYWNSGASSDDGSGKYGYATFAPVTLVTRGTAYTVGQYIYYGLPAGFTDHQYALKLRIEAVDSVGGILSLRPIQTGAFPPGTYTAGTKNLAHPVDGGGSPLTSDTGTGAQITVGISQVGPTKNYSFPDFDPNSVASWNFYIVDGGTGYTPGDVLGITELSLLALTVNSVDGAGKILTWTLTHNTISTGLPADVLAMPVTGGSGTGATFGGMVIMGQNPGWATELARLRGKIAGVKSLSGETLANTLSPQDYDGVSGPWPVAAPTNNFKDTWFYYADTGHAESVTLLSKYFPGSYGKMETIEVKKVSTETFGGDGWWTELTDIASDPGWSIGQHVPGGIVIAKWTGGDYFEYSVRPEDTSVTAHVGVYSTRNEYEIIIGGTSGVAVNGVFFLQGKINRGQTVHRHRHGVSGPGYYDTTTTTPDTTDPKTLVAVSGTFPGTVSKHVYAGYDGTEILAIAFEVNETLAPGRYKIILDITVPPNDTDDRVNYLGTTYTAYADGHPVYDGNTIDDEDFYVVPTRVNFIAIPLGISRNVLSGCATAVFHDASPYPNPPDLSGNATATIVYNSAVNAEGIHGSAQVLKINLPGDDIGIGAGIGVIIVNASNNYLSDPYPQPVFLPERIFMNYVSITPSTAGFWTAFCQMVDSLHTVTNNLMPWNLNRTRFGVGGSISYNPMLVGDLAPNMVNGSSQNVQRISNSYDQNKLVEEQMEPPGWKANTWFSVGFTIMDSNGNMQTVQTAGGSGATAPGWSTVLGGTVTDGTGLDIYGHSQAIITWKCVAVNTPARSITPAVHRLPNLANGESGLPRYPVYWDAETVAKMKPPVGGSDQPLTIWGAGHQWKKLFYQGSSYDPGWHDNNLAYGWWIYSVSLSRMSFVVRTPPTDSAGGNDSAGDTGTGAGGGGGNEVAVTIGCIRSGAFVAFGTYATGQTIQVLWPVFTSDALVYQCSERVDIQAVAIASDNTVGFGSGVNYPILSAYVNDTENLLTLINQN